MPLLIKKKNVAPCIADVPFFISSSDPGDNSSKLSNFDPYCGNKKICRLPTEGKEKGRR